MCSDLSCLRGIEFPKDYTCSEPHAGQITEWNNCVKCSLSYPGVIQDTSVKFILILKTFPIGGCSMLRMMLGEGVGAAGGAATVTHRSVWLQRARRRGPPMPPARRGGAWRGVAPAAFGA